MVYNTSYLMADIINKDVFRYLFMHLSATMPAPVKHLLLVFKFLGHV